jgi:hypothetical protein
MDLVEFAFLAEDIITSVAMEPQHRWWVVDRSCLRSPHSPPAISPSGIYHFAIAEDPSSLPGHPARS